MTSKRTCGENKEEAMKIDNGFKGDERRKNNGEIRLSARDWYSLVVIIIGATLWLGKLQWTATAQEEKIKKIEQTPQDIALIQKDVIYIKQDLSEVKDDVGDIKKDIRLILEKL